MGKNESLETRANRDREKNLESGNERDNNESLETRANRDREKNLETKIEYFKGPVLVDVKGEIDSVPIENEEKVFVIGRGERNGLGFLNDLKINEPCISDPHCYIFSFSGSKFITDAVSKNGVGVNNEIVPKLRIVYDNFELIKDSYSLNKIKSIIRKKEFLSKNKIVRGIYYWMLGSKEIRKAVVKEGMARKLESEDRIFLYKNLSKSKYFEFSYRDFKKFGNF